MGQTGAVFNRHNNNGSRYKFQFRKNSKSKAAASAKMDQVECGGEAGSFMMNDPKSTSTVASDLSITSAAVAATGVSLDGPNKVIQIPPKGTSMCRHCNQPFQHSNNMRGDCPATDRPDRFRDCIETISCLSCAKCLHYHCIADSDAHPAQTHPCSCSNADGHFGIRWLSLTLLSVLVPCLCLYPPLAGCYQCGRACHICGSTCEASGPELGPPAKPP